MIRKLKMEDKPKLEKILLDTNNFSEAEIETAIELIDTYINVNNHGGYEIFVDEGDKNIINGYICIGRRPLTKATFDLYWIAVNPQVQSKGIGSELIKYIEKHIKENGGKLILIETSGKPSYEKERNFYEKNLYIKITEIKDFYDEGDSLVIYGKYI